MSDSVHYGHHAPNLVDSSVRHGYVVRTVGSSLFRLEFTRQPRRKSLCDRLLFVYFRWSVLDALRLLAARQTAHAEDVAVFCAGWLPVVRSCDYSGANGAHVDNAKQLYPDAETIRTAPYSVPGRLLS